jgi:hypothetical protein
MSFSLHLSKYNTITELAKTAAGSFLLGKTSLTLIIIIYYNQFVLMKIIIKKCRGDT